MGSMKGWEREKERKREREEEGKREKEKRGEKGMGETKKTKSTERGVQTSISNSKEKKGGSQTNYFISLTLLSLFLSPSLSHTLPLSLIVLLVVDGEHR